MPSPISNVAIAPDGRTVVTIGTGANEILLWDIATGQVRQRLETVGRVIFALGVSHDGLDVGFGFSKKVQLSRANGRVRRNSVL